MMKHHSWSSTPPRLFAVITSVLLALVAVLAMTNTAVAHAQDVAGGAGQNPILSANTGKLLRPKTPAEVQREKDKEALVAAWVARTHNGMTLPATTNASVTPDCVVNPDTGQCVVYVTGGSVGGQYIQEPYDEPNWCGPSSATAVMLHWNYNAVVNFGSVTVPNNANTGSETYSGSQGYMAWLANKIWIPADNHYGVSYVPYANGSPIGWLKDGLNVATGTSYYIVHTSSTAADMEGNVEYDISHDGHPMIYLANAEYLPEWTVNYTVNHYVEGYGWGYYSDSPSVHWDMYADAISASDTRATAGDWKLDEDSMFYAVQKSYSDFIV